MQSRPMTEPGLITQLQPISVLSRRLRQIFLGRWNVAVRCVHRDFRVIEFDVGENHARTKVSVVTQDGITDIIEVRYLHFIEQDAILNSQRVTHHNAIPGDDVLAHVTAAANLAIFTNPGRTFQHRTLLNNRSSADKDAIADEWFAIRSASTAGLRRNCK